MRPIAVQILVATICLAVGCGIVARGELSAAQCDASDPNDDDGDGKKNCKDPDCWVFPWCGDEAQLAQAGASASGGGTAGAAGSSNSSSGGAAAGSSGGAAFDDDGGLPASATDGGPPVDPCAGVTCATDEVCNAVGVCVSNVFPLDIDIRVSSAAVASADKLSNCFDVFCANTISIPNFACSCAPDSMLVVYVDDVQIGQSAVVVDQLNPTWPANTPAIRAHLESAQSVLTFSIVDFDETTPEREIFRCAPDLTQIETATSLQCTQPWFAISASPPPPDGLFRVTANIAPVSPQ